MVRSTGIAARALTSVLAQEVRIDTGRGHSVLKKAERYWNRAYMVFSWESCLRRQGLRPWELSLLLPSSSSPHHHHPPAHHHTSSPSLHKHSSRDFKSFRGASKGAKIQN